ncbi:MAG TPA: hypothetical protein PLD59_07870, partial [Tepidisphaeraceae bacterium]|nr:hypothetical protein [Tepidisphaeraceae bacterium]
IQIAEYIACDNRAAAERFIVRALESIDFITFMPDPGSRYEAAPPKWARSEDGRSEDSPTNQSFIGWRSRR